MPQSHLDISVQLIDAGQNQEIPRGYYLPGGGNFIRLVVGKYYGDNLNWDAAQTAFDKAVALLGDGNSMPLGDFYGPFYNPSSDPVPIFFFGYKNETNTSDRYWLAFRVTRRGEGDAPMVVNWITSEKGPGEPSTGSAGWNYDPLGDSTFTYGFAGTGDNPGKAPPVWGILCGMHIFITTKSVAEISRSLAEIAARPLEHGRK